MFELERLNERFLKDFDIKIKPDIAYTDYFDARLNQYELYKPGTIEKYEEFKKYITDTYENMDSYYNERNNFIKNVLTDQQMRQKKYGIEGNELKEYNIKKYPFSRKDVYNDEGLNKTFISMDLKSASFQALRYFNKEIIRNTDSYKDYVSLFTDKLYFDNKRIRSSIFGKTCNDKIAKIEKFITEKILLEVLKTEEESSIKSFNNDEVVFEVQNDSSTTVENVKKFAKNLDIIVDIEQFELSKIVGSDNGYVKNLIDLNTGERKKEFCGLNINQVPFAIAALSKTEIEDELLYFVNQEGYLCKMIEYPKFNIQQDKEKDIER